MKGIYSSVWYFKRVMRVNGIMFRSAVVYFISLRKTREWQPGVWVGVFTGGSLWFCLGTHSFRPSPIKPGFMWKSLRNPPRLRRRLLPRGYLLVREVMKCSDLLHQVQLQSGRIPVHRLTNAFQPEYIHSREPSFDIIKGTDNDRSTVASQM